MIQEPVTEAGSAIRLTNAYLVPTPENCILRSKVKVEVVAFEPCVKAVNSVLTAYTQPATGRVLFDSYCSTYETAVQDQFSLSFRIFCSI